MEELQLELSAALKSKSGRQTQQHIGSTVNSGGTATVTWAPTPTQLPSQHHSQHTSSSSSSAATAAAAAAASSVLQSQSSRQTQQGTEIDRIMAKIEQARLEIANVCHNLNTKRFFKTKNHYKSTKKNINNSNKNTPLNEKTKNKASKLDNNSHAMNCHSITKLKPFVPYPSHMSHNTKQNTKI